MSAINSEYVLKRIQVKHWSVAGVLFTVLFVLIMGRFLIGGKAKILVNTQSSDGDESAYLALGLDLREAGVLTDGTRPPLYPLLLAALARREWTYFTAAKWLTLGLGAMAIVAVLLAGRGLFSWQVGLAAAFLLAANREFHLRASTVYADTLMVTVFLGAWYCLIKSFSQRRYLYAAGFMVGLAYLTKGSAPLLLGAWGLVALNHYRRAIFRQKALLVVPIIFLITVSPLLIYNARVFGSPGYNFATTHVMWMDRWDDSQVADTADLPTLSSYIQTHTWADVVARLQRGSEKLHPVLATTLIPARSWKPPWLGMALLTVAMLIAAGLLLFRRDLIVDYYRERRLAIQLTVILLAAYYLFSLWYAAVLIESRFLIPVLGLVYLFIADVALQLGRGAKAGLERLSAGRAAIYPGLYRVTAGLITVGAAVWLVQTTRVEAWSLPIDSYAADQAANLEVDAVIDNLIKANPESQIDILHGPSKSLPLWKMPRHFALTEIPVDYDNWAALEAHLTQQPPDYIIIDADTARRRRAALSQFFGYDEERGYVQIRQIPPAWVLDQLYGEEPCRWCIFKPWSKIAGSMADTTDNAITFQSPENLTANLADKIEWIGLEVQPHFTEGQRLLNVTLYWHDLEPVAEDYTIFLHLTAPDGFVKAQQDQQPFAGLWPTSQWQPGDLLAVHFEIPLDESVQPGDYLLLTGMYSLASGDRLPLIEGPTGPSANAILLGQLEIKK